MVASDATDVDGKSMRSHALYVIQRCLAAFLIGYIIGVNGVDLFTLV